MIRMWGDGGDDVDRRLMVMLAMEKLQLEDGVQGDDTPPTSPLHKPANVRTSTWEEYRAPSASLTGLNAITIPELLSDSKHHCGRVLYGKFCIQPVMTQSVPDIVTLLVDTNANAIRVIMSKLTYYNEPTRGLSESLFSLGKEVAIKEPLIEMCKGGIPAARVINLSDVISLENANAEDEPRAGNVDAISLEELEKIRHDGNQFFAMHDWTAAVKLYSRCINQALLLKLASNGSHRSEENFSSLLLFAYSNRAEARLRLELYEDAFGDTEKAVQIEPNHLKTLVRKGRAAYALGLFEKSCEAFKAALQQSPREKSILKSLAASTTALRLSRTGEFDLSSYLLKGCTGEVPCCVDFVGPVEIRRVDHVNCRRGLFATRSVKSGDLLLVSNPLAVCRKKFSDPHFRMDLETISMSADLIVDLSKRTRKSKRLMAQLCSLCRNGKDEMEVPSMELFKAGSEWIPECSENFNVDADIISEIVSKNACLMISDPGEQNIQQCSEATLGVWALPSFASHACSPNVCHTHIGDAIFFRASADIVEGEELTISYLEESDLLYNQAKARQAVTEGLGFTCECARCLVEESFQGKLSKIRQAFSYLQAAIIHSGAYFFLRSEEQQRVQKDLSELVNEIELVIHSCGSKFAPREQDWIRVTFFLAYCGKFGLALNQGDPQACILAVRLLLNSITSVYVGPDGLHHAIKVLKEVERKFGKHAETYMLTLDLVLSIFNVYYGKQHKDVLQKLVISTQQKLD